MVFVVLVIVGSRIHAVSCPVVLLYCSISWSSFPSLLFVKMMSSASFCANRAMSASCGIRMRSGKLLCVPLTYAASIVSGFRYGQLLLYHAPGQVFWHSSVPVVVMLLSGFWLLYSVCIHCGVLLVFCSLTSSIVPFQYLLV